MKIQWTLSLGLLLAGPAHAHDSWLQPRSFQTPAPGRIPITFFVGHLADQHSAALLPQPKWLRSLQAHNSRGRVDLLTNGRFTRAGVNLPTPGTYIVSLDTYDFRHQMEPADFGPYMDEEGLAAAKVAWARQPITGRVVRELYRRHSKALIQVGRGQAARVGPATKRLGQRLELVPAVNPHSLTAGQPLTATVWYDDRPLAGALVTLGDLGRPKVALLKVRSGPDGKASFSMPKSGRWMMNVVWSVPSAVSSADYQTSFSSLTFGIPPPR